MRWSEIRAAYPEQWLVLEVYSASHDGATRCIDDVEVFGSCSDGMAAIKCAYDLGRRFRGREFVAAHTSHVTISSEDRSWHGLQGLAARSMISL